ncbi:MAG: DnaD domain protein [Lachnospiraceae bacterium]|nr:DnaD domain protein [Lachnospiraceae bacterium]
MSGLSVTNQRRCGVTVVSNQFIDRFLPEANGEFVKVYLLLLRQVSEGRELSVSHMADGLDNTEKDVMRALKYWEKMKLLRLEYGTDQALSGIVFLDEETVSETACTAEKTEGSLLADKQQGKISEDKEGRQKKTDEEGKSGLFAAREQGIETEKPEKGGQAAEKTADLQELQADEDFCQLLYLAGRYTAKNLTPRDCDVLAHLYGGLGMSAELLEYLVEYCVSNGHKSMRYIETVALNWNERGIKTVEQAKVETVNGGKNTYAVLKAFGLGGRNPAAAERSMIDRWFRDYGFSLEVVLEACDRTMRVIHQPSFEYADKILKDWKVKGIRVKDDISRMDGKVEGGQTKAKIEKRGTKRPNKFHNFSQRDYDYDALVKELNGF